MSTYLWKGIDPGGRPAVERVAAESAAEARRLLEGRGYTGLRLQSDEVSEAARAGVREVSPPEYRAVISADQELAYHEGRGPGFWQSWGKALIEGKWLSVFLVALLAWGLYQGQVWLIALPLAGLLIFPLIFAWFSWPGYLYDRLNRAKVWSRWDEVLRIAEQLRRVQRWVRIGVPLWEIHRCRAQALAGMDRLADALREWEACARIPQVPRWMFLAHLASIFEIGRQFDRALECRLQSVREKTDNAGLWIDLAMHYAHRQANPAKAREALARGQQLELVELARPYVHLVEGIIRIREQAAARACDELQMALDGLAPFGHSSLVLSVVLLAKSYLCPACAAAGDLESARRLRAETAEFLRAGREEELDGLGQKALGMA